MAKKKNNKLFTAVVIVLCTALFFILFSLFFIDNKNVVYESFYVNKRGTDKNSVSEIKIAQLSDMHFPRIKVDIQKLLKRLEEENIDMVFITGDLIDRSADIGQSGVYEFIEKLKLIAPIYYVNGNHETGHRDSNELYTRLLLNNVTILNNKSKNVSIKNVNFTIMGLTDNRDYNPNYFIDNNEAANNYRILIAHRPEKWQTYTSSSFAIKPDLVLCGHAHGGQIRIFGKGLLAPDQGFFPKYDAGLYTNEENDVNMIVSRGIGNSIFPFRLNNKPHVPIITIQL